MVVRRTSLACAFAGALALAGCASAVTSPSAQGNSPPPNPGPTSVSIPPIVAPTTTPPTAPVQIPPTTTPPAVTYPPLRTSPPAPPPPPQPPPTQSINPASVVEAYYAAINRHDYARAWPLGGENLGQSYAEFSAGFADTEVDSVEIIATHGHTVSIYLTAVNYDGSQETFAGSYTVIGGQITGASISQTG